MYGISWQNLLMMNSTIPPVGEDGDADSGTTGSKKPISFWEMGQKLMQGKGV